MVNFDACQLLQLSIHQLIHSENTQLVLSKNPVQNIGESVDTLLKQYFLSWAKESLEFERFTFSNGDHELNPLYIFAKEIFSNPDQFHDHSKNIAKHLYQASQHPNIKSGELCVALFDQIMIEDEIIQAIGIFKSETKDEFLKIISDNASWEVQSEWGLALSKLDKGCLIYNYQMDDGYVLSVADRSNRGSDAQYWKHTFINSTPRQDAFTYTKTYMNLAQSYISHQLTEEFEVSKPDQINLLNKTSQYFKSKDHFEKEEFEREIFNSQELIDSFDAYSKDYQQELKINLGAEFGISKAAVKKSAKDFKSVLKLDKNFHVYIHGDRQMIERGTDEDGRKYYKLYFESES
jgi:hypothetical protein